MTDASTAPAGRLHPTTLARWALQVVVALVFFAAAVNKLAGTSQMVAVFDQIGIGQWFRVFVAIVEIAGGVLLLWPGRSAFGALVLSATMAGALVTHVAIIGGMWQPAAVLFALSLLLLWLNRAQLEAFGRGRRV